MKSFIRLLTLAIGLLLLTANSSSAQTVKPEDRPASEKSLSDLVNEVRQLRAMLLRINQTAYKTNIVIERLKFQQEQVARLSREIDNLREALAELRVEKTSIKEKIESAETEVKNGTASTELVRDLKERFEVFSQRELRFAQRETQLTNELTIERSKLMELTDRLNTLELELK